jgi:hypothetical protein
MENFLIFSCMFGLSRRLPALNGVGCSWELKQSLGLSEPSIVCHGSSPSRDNLLHCASMRSDCRTGASGQANFVLLIMEIIRFRRSGIHRWNSMRLTIEIMWVSIASSCCQTISESPLTSPQRSENGAESFATGGSKRS